jgi:hypothetical protein
MILTFTYLTMTSNSKITAQRYRSAVLRYACALSKKRSTAINKLPPDTLAGLGIGVAVDRYGASHIKVKVVPENLDVEGVRTFVNELESFAKKNEGPIAPVKKKGKKKGRGRPRKERSEFHGNAPMDEDLVGINVSTKPGLGAEG